MSRFRGTTSGGPDFAYRLCVQKVTDAESFAARFRRAGKWRSRAPSRCARRRSPRSPPASRRRVSGAKLLYPTYGLAESTLIVTGSRPLTPWVTTRADSDANARPQVGCGAALEGMEIAIVDPSAGPS